MLKRIRVIDSHTGGEPTRTVIDGDPDVGDGNLHQRLLLFQRDHEAFRRAIVTEPRSSDAMVGALLCKPTNAECVTGVIFFNNSGCLGMCGHGTIGVVATLAYLGKIKPGHHRIETPVGIVGARLTKTIPSPLKTYPVIDMLPPSKCRTRIRPGHGDIAWGGNWFFLVKDHPYTLDRAHLDQLIDYTWAIRQALTANNIHGAVEPRSTTSNSTVLRSSPNIDSRNFVLCPGKEYDRSPCGTGTSAKLACLLCGRHPRSWSSLAPGKHHRQRLRRPPGTSGMDTSPQHHRLRLCHRRVHPHPGSRGRLLLGHPAMTSSFDAVIVGGGIVGAACARAFSQRGLRVALVEQGEIGAGATAAAMGHIVVSDDSPAQTGLDPLLAIAMAPTGSCLPPDAEYTQRGTLWVAADDEEMQEICRKHSVYSDAGIPSEQDRCAIARPH